MKRYDQKAYKLPPPTQADVPAETNKRPFEEQPGPSSKRFPNRVFITPINRPSVAPVLIARPSTTLASPQPMIISEPPILDSPVQIPATPELTTPRPPVQIPVFQLPVQIPDPPVKIQVTLEPTKPQPPVQLFLPDPPPIRSCRPYLETARNKGLKYPRIIPKNPRCLTFQQNVSAKPFSKTLQQNVSITLSDENHPELWKRFAEGLGVTRSDTVPSLFDDSNDLISFLDHFETGLATEQQETPMHLTMPRLKKKVKRATGFNPLSG
ncbi:hypothetical protein TNCV_4772041 [Trichonephila clavipes]|nr:hypothetical protein TNCV_4772041 [Trichonephila clavipes]